MLKALSRNPCQYLFRYCGRTISVSLASSKLHVVNVTDQSSGFSLDNLLGSNQFVISSGTLSLIKTRKKLYRDIAIV